jgi:hypothetical protein
MGTVWHELAMTPRTPSNIAGQVLQNRFHGIRNEITPIRLSGSCPLVHPELIALPGSKDLFSRRNVVVNRTAMAKNAEPRRILIKLPTTIYAAPKKRPLAASSGRLLIKERKPRVAKPIAKTSNPAPVEYFSRCLGIFIAKMGIDLAASFVSRENPEVQFCKPDESPNFRGEAQRREAGRSVNEAKSAASFASGLVLRRKSSIA